MSHRTAEAVPAIVFDEPDPQRPVGVRLQAAVDRGVHLVAGALGVGAESLPQLESRHFRDVGRLRGEQGRMGARHDRLFLRGSRRRLIYIAQREHATQDVRAAHRRELGIHDGVVMRGRLGETGDGGGLRDRELVEGLAEESLGGRRHPVGALAKEDVIQIEPEDFLFGEFVLHCISDESLLQLTTICLIESQEDVASSLHGDRAGALGLVARNEVYGHRAHHTEIVDAVVLEETIVLRRQEGMFYQVRDLVVGDRNTPLFADLRDQCATARVNPQGHLHLDVAHCLR